MNILVSEDAFATIEARPTEVWDRRWCFEIVCIQKDPGFKKDHHEQQTNNLTLLNTPFQTTLLAVYQAEGEEDLKEWLRAFQNIPLLHKSAQNNTEITNREIKANPDLNLSTDEPEKRTTIKPADALSTMTEVPGQLRTLLDAYPEAALPNAHLHQYFPEVPESELGLLDFPAAAINGLLLGRVFASATHLYCFTSVFGVERRAWYDLGHVAEMRVVRGLFWLDLILTSACSSNADSSATKNEYHENTEEDNSAEEDPGEPDFTVTVKMILEDNADAVVEALERIIDHKRRVRRQPMVVLLDALFRNKKTVNNNNAAEVDGKLPAPYLASLKETSSPVLANKNQSSTVCDRCPCLDHGDLMPMYDAVFPITLDQLLELMFHEEGDKVTLEFYRRVGYTAVKFEPWSTPTSPSAKGGRNTSRENLNSPPGGDSWEKIPGSNRQLHFSMPNFFMKSKQTPGVEDLILKEYTKDKCAVLAKTVSMPEILYGDCFQVTVRFCFTTNKNNNNGGNCTRVQVHQGIKWLRSTIMRGFIASNTTKITREGVQCHMGIVEELVRERVPGNQGVIFSSAAIDHNQPRDDQNILAPSNLINGRDGMAGFLLRGIHTMLLAVPPWVRLLMLVWSVAVGWALVTWLRRPVVRPVYYSYPSLIASGHPLLAQNETNKKPLALKTLTGSQQTENPSNNSPDVNYANHAAISGDDEEVLEIAVIRGQLLDALHELDLLAVDLAAEARNQSTTGYNQREASGNHSKHQKDL